MAYPGGGLSSRRAARRRRCCRPPGNSRRLRGAPCSARPETRAPSAGTSRKTATPATSAHVSDVAASGLFTLGALCTSSPHSSVHGRCVVKLSTCVAAFVDSPRDLFWCFVKQTLCVKSCVLCGLEWLRNLFGGVRFATTRLVRFGCVHLHCVKWILCVLSAPVHEIEHNLKPCWLTANYLLVPVHMRGNEF